MSGGEAADPESRGGGGGGGGVDSDSRQKCLYILACVYGIAGPIAIEPLRSPFVAGLY